MRRRSGLLVERFGIETRWTPSRVENDPLREQRIAMFSALNLT